MPCTVLGRRKGHSTIKKEVTQKRLWHPQITLECLGWTPDSSFLLKQPLADSADNLSSWIQASHMGAPVCGLQPWHLECPRTSGCSHCLPVCPSALGVDWVMLSLFLTGRACVHGTARTGEVGDLPTGPGAAGSPGSSQPTVWEGRGNLNQKLKMPSQGTCVCP